MVNDENAEDLSIILELQSPFRWKPAIHNENRHEFDLEHEDTGTFSFLNFCARIIEAYDQYVNGSKTSGEELLEKIEKKLQEVENATCENDFFTKIKDALYHVVYACKAHMALTEGKYGGEITESLKKLKFDEMNETNRAAMSAIKACANSLYNNNELDTSLSQINTALSLDNTTAFWKFLKGTILNRLRRTNEVPSLQEREMFEAAYEKKKSNPLFMVYLADVYREMCKYKPKSYLWFIAKSAQFNAEDRMNEKYETALNLYRQSYELKPNCPVIAFKCANGLMRLPQKHQDVKLIKKIISDCKKKFPNSGFGNLVCAMYHERIDKKTDLAQRCLEKCVELNVFNGCMNSIRNDYVAKKENANIVERLEKMLDVFHEAAKREIIISQIISYYVFVDTDIEKACEYMLKYYRKITNTSGHYLEKHISCFKSLDGPVSLVNVITDQVKIKMKNRELPAEKRKFYNEFVRQMSFFNVDVLKGNPKNLLDQIQKAAVPKGKNPNKARSNEAQKSSQSRHASRDGDAKRQDAPRDGRGAGRGGTRGNTQNYASPKRFDNRRQTDRPGDQRAPFDRRLDGQLGGANSNNENGRRNDTSPRRPGYRHPAERAADRPASFDKRPNSSVARTQNDRPAALDKGATSGFGDSAKNVPRNDASLRGNNRQPPQERANQQPASSGERSAVNKKKAESDQDDFKMLMSMCRQGNRDDLDDIFQKWKALTLKDTKIRSEAPRIVPEENTRQADLRASKELDEVASRRGRRSRDHSLENRRSDRSQSEASDRSRKHKHRHHKYEADRRRDRSLSESSDRSRRHKHHRKSHKADEDVTVSKGRSRRSEDRSLEDRHRDRSLSKTIERSHKHRHRKPKKHHRDSSRSDDEPRRSRDRDIDAVSEERSRRSEDDSVENRRRDRSLSKASSRHKHRHRKSHKDKDAALSEERNDKSEDDSAEYRRRDRSLSKDNERSHRRRRKHKKHRHHSSGSEDERRRSRDRHGRRKHRKSESDSDRSTDRRREKHHRSKKKHSKNSDSE